MDPNERRSIKKRGLSMIGHLIQKTSERGVRLRTAPKNTCPLDSPKYRRDMVIHKRLIRKRRRYVDLQLKSLRRSTQPKESANTRKDFLGA